MPRVIVTTAAGVKVADIEVDRTWSPWTLGRKLIGRNESLLGPLGRALDDARAIEDGRDPERPSEKVMRILAEREEDAELAAQVDEAVPVERRQRIAAEDDPRGVADR